jgi:hypothetical protein
MKNDSDSFFVDANVLVYAAVKDDPRNKVPKALLKNSRIGMPYISAQILAECYSTITSPKRVTAPYAQVEAVEFIEKLLEYEHVTVLDRSTVSAIAFATGSGRPSRTSAFLSLPNGGRNENIFFQYFIAKYEHPQTHAIVGHSPR